MPRLIHPIFSRSLLFKAFFSCWLLGVSLLPSFSQAQTPNVPPPSLTSPPEEPNLGTEVPNDPEPSEDSDLTSETPDSPAKDRAQPESSNASMEERTLEPRGVLASPEPEFVIEGSSARVPGLYFGVGFRQVRLDLRGNRSFTHNDGTSNGVAFNLGYFQSDWAFEYSRHVSLIDLNEVLVFDGRLFNFVEVIQNNFWYFFSNRLAKDFYFHYGLGFQTTEIRLILEDEQVSEAQDLESRSELRREDSLIFGLGLTYFITHNFSLQYRSAQGNFSPLLTGSKVHNVMHSSQLHMLFLQYYFSL